MSEIDKQRQKTLLQTYGADQARWPAADRNEALTAGSPEWRQARAIDGILSAASQPQVPAGLAARIAASAGPQASNVVPFTPGKARKVPYWPATAALAASLAIGIYLGATSGGDVFLPAGDTAALDDPLDLMNLDQADDSTSGDSV